VVAETFPQLINFNASLKNGASKSPPSASCKSLNAIDILEMDDTRMLKLTLKFKDKIRQEIDKNMLHDDNMKSWLWKTLIMSEIAHRSLSLKIPIEQFEKQYFDKQAAVGRHFCDWDMDWVAENYYEISNYIAKYHWPDNDKQGFNKDYIPFKNFNLEDK
jgi:hypothetical protein